MMWRIKRRSSVYTSPRMNLSQFFSVEITNFLLSVCILDGIRSSSSVFLRNSENCEESKSQSYKKKYRFGYAKMETILRTNIIKTHLNSSTFYKNLKATNLNSTIMCSGTS